MTFRPRRAVAALATLALAGTLVAAVPGGASADDGNTLTVVGTADVFDSFLVQNVIKPGFEAANPGITLNYVSKGTGAALDYARTGAASAVLVHAASLENQFVSQGYSLEPYGRSIFWGDFVLVGPKNSDPAGVLSSSHDIVSAYEKVAAAGSASTPTADFVSRGGTPGTTVQEHALWALTGTGVTKCDVPAASGGGQSPFNGTGACVSDGSYPSWYHATGLSQALNVQNANTCNYGHGQDCYVFTDRGTFQYLESQGSVPNLRIMVRNNDTTARGGLPALINAFHAYAVNPAKFSGAAASGINTVAATKLLNWITSPAAQRAIQNYLAPDSPFIPAAAPEVTFSAVPTAVTGSKTLSFTGRVADAIPGYPNLSGVPIQLKASPDAIKGSAGTTVATATTDANGNFSMRYRPTYGATYSIAVPQVQKIENASLSPAFGDILQATTVSVGHVGVVGSFSSKAKRVGRTLKVRGALNPKVFGQKGKILLYRAKPGHKLRYAGQKRLKRGATHYTASFRFRRGTWKWEVVYVNDGRITRRHSPIRVVRIP